MTDSPTIKTGTFMVTDVEQIGVADDKGVIAYNVHVKGIDQSLFMRAKRAPEVGKEESGEIKRETSQKGKQYYRFYREQKAFGGSNMQPVLDKLDALHADVRKLLGDEPSPEQEQARKEAERDAASLKKDTVIEDFNEDDPIDLKDIPF